MLHSFGVLVVLSSIQACLISPSLAGTPDCEHESLHLLQKHAGMVFGTDPNTHDETSSKLSEPRGTKSSWLMQRLHGQDGSGKTPRSEPQPGKHNDWKYLIGGISGTLIVCITWLVVQSASDSGVDAESKKAANIAVGAEDDNHEFKERYAASRKRAAEINTETQAPLTNLDDFAHWYPNVQSWKWRRTISFWIGITFFEGSIFFTVSSFLYNYLELLGPYQEAATFYGYLVGKMHYVVCTYLMCIQTINLPAEHQGQSGDESESKNTINGAADDVILLNPFRYQTALANLKAVGSGPWPYLTSLVFFTGVLTFAVGFAAELIPGVPDDVEDWVVRWAFLFGSFQFVLGGVFECIENKVFRSCKFTSGYLGAFLNLIGGLAFQVGSVLPFFPAVNSYWANLWFGIGSVAFLVGSSVMLVMWRDEQFGLTFLAAINNLGGPNGKPMVSINDEPAHEKVSFSMAGIFFIHLYCIAGAASTYNFMIELTNFGQDRSFRRLQLAFNELLPCAVVHMVIALRSAVVRTPHASPYFQLFACMRGLALIMTASSTYTFIEMLLTEKAIV